MSSSLFIDQHIFTYHINKHQSLPLHTTLSTAPPPPGVGPEKFPGMMGEGPFNAYGHWHPESHAPRYDGHGHGHGRYAHPPRGGPYWHHAGYYMHGRGGPWRGLRAFKLILPAVALYGTYRLGVHIGTKRTLEGTNDWSKSSPPSYIAPPSPQSSENLDVAAATNQRQEKRGCGGGWWSRRREAEQEWQRRKAEMQEQVRQMWQQQMAAPMTMPIPGSQGQQAGDGRLV